MPNSRPLTRRTLLLGAVGVVAAGCTFMDPRVTGTPYPAPTPTATPPPPVDLAEVLGREVALAQLLESSSRAPAPPLAQGLRAHVTALQEAWDTTPGTGDAPDPKDPAGATAASHRSAALQVGGRLGFQLAMLAAYASGAARALQRPSVSVARAPLANIRPSSDTEAMAALLSQVHAALWAVQTATGVFALSDDAREPFVARSDQLRDLRDGLTAVLVERGIEPPAAEPAYEVSKPADAAGAVALGRTVETRLLPFAGAAVLADTAGSRQARTLCLNALVAGTVRLVATGGALPLWPGQPV